MSVLLQFHLILLLYSCAAFVLQKDFLHVLLIYPPSHIWSKYFMEENVECADSSIFFLTKSTVPGTERYIDGPNCDSYMSDGLKQ